jgi:hypothetical protein
LFEYVIGTLKTAFAHGRLTRDELDARAGQASAARTKPTWPRSWPASRAQSGMPATSRPRPPAPPAGRWPLARAAVKAGMCPIIAAVAVRAASTAVPGGARRRTTRQHRP